MMCAKSWQTPCLVDNASSIGESTRVLCELYSKRVKMSDISRRSVASGRRRARAPFPRPVRRAGLSGARTGSDSAHPRTRRPPWPRRGAPTRRRSSASGRSGDVLHSTKASAVTVSREWRPWNVEVVNDVAVGILVHANARRGRRAQTEPDAVLRPVAARLHARLHDAFADGRFVGELGDVSNRVLHVQPLDPSLQPRP